MVKNMHLEKRTDGFNFAKESSELYDLKVSIQDEFLNNEYDMEKTYQGAEEVIYN